MGSIVGAALVSHVPTLVLPEETRRELNHGDDISLFDGLHRLRAERLAPLDADTVVVLDTHWHTTVEFGVSAHARRSGLYTSEELPRGMCQMPYDIVGDPEFAHAWAAAADDRDDMWITAFDDPCLPIHYPTVNILGFLQGDERWVSASVAQSGERDDFLRYGECLREAVEATDRRVVILASGGLSHRFWPLQQLRAHEAADPDQHIVTSEACAADRAVIEQLLAGEHAAVIDGYDDFRAHAPEGRFGHYLTMIGALGGADCTATGTTYSEYEAVAGTGQIHIWFDV